MIQCRVLTLHRPGFCVGITAPRATESAPLRSRLSRGLRCSKFDLQFNTSAKPVEDRYQAIKCKPSQICVSNAREVRRCDPGAIVCGPYAQALPIGLFDHSSREDGFALLDVRVDVPEVSEDISAASHQIQPVPSRSDSFFGMPLVDHFSPVCALKRRRCGYEVLSGAIWCCA